MYQLPVIDNQLTKTQLSIIAQSVVHSLGENGNIIEAVETIAKMENLIKEIKASPEFKDYVRSEIEKYGKEITSNNGVKIELAEVATKYDFTQCNDSILSELEFKFSHLEDEIKKRKDFLKGLPREGVDIIDHDGEVKRLFPPSKSSTSSYKVSIAK